MTDRNLTNVMLYLDLFLTKLDHDWKSTH